MNPTRRTQMPQDLPGLVSRCGLFFASLVFFMMTSLVSLGLWHEDRSLYMREQAAGCYTPGPYFVAKVAVDAFLVSQPIFHFFSRFFIVARFFYFLFFCCCTK